MCSKDVSLDRSLPLICSEPYFISSTASEIVCSGFLLAAVDDFSKGLVLFGLVRCHSLAANAPKNEEDRTVSIRFLPFQELFFSR